MAVLTWNQRRTATTLLAKTREAIALIQDGHEYSGRFYNTSNVFGVHSLIYLCEEDRTVRIYCFETFALLLYIREELMKEGFVVTPLKQSSVSLNRLAWMITIHVPRQ